ncbi:DNA polymerase III subunit beta [Mesorhizobium plurifarium]|uniref:Beta sliding clamp n=1 Tax=Mesorhizobium plurifarium TaxID=69974 RepID=A0A090EA38_MESPL|nr:DNA polymerase III subunit beta [Mesorhizobium plurifarium]
MNAFNHDIARLSAGVAACALADIDVSNVIPFAPRPVDPVADMPEPIAAEPVAEAAAAAEAPAASLAPATAVVDRAALTRALDFIANVVERRNTIPILSNVMLAASDNGLVVTGTDLDIEISVAVSGAIDSHFALTLPAHTLRDLLKRASASEFVGFTSPNLSDDDAWAATVDLEKVKYQLQMLPVADFPSLHYGASSHCFSVPGADLVDGFGGVAMAISTEETRYYLNGVYLHHVEPRAIDRYHGDLGALRMVATDGHRMCRQDLTASEGMAGMPGVILPRKTVALLQKLLKGKACPATVDIGVNETKMRFSFDGVTITSKLIDGSYPDYQRVIPTNNDKPATFKSAELAEGIRSVSLISSARNRGVKLDVSADACRLTAHDVDNGTAVAEIAATYAGDSLEIGFNPSYLQAFIDTAESETITLTLADAGSPTLITGDRKGWLGVLMPMRV